MNDVAYYIQNPALGSCLISEFVKGYCSASHQGTPMILSFIVLPFLFDSKCRSSLISCQRKKGIHNLLSKINDDSKDNSIYLINERAKLLRTTSFDSIVVGVASLQIKMDVENGLLFPDNASAISVDIKSDSVTKMIKASYKFGEMLSPYSIAEISSFLKVRF